MNTVRNARAAQAAPPEPCEERHRPLRSLVWQLFGGFVVVLLTIALAAAGHMAGKADADDLRLIEVRTRQLESQFGAIRGDLGELRAGQEFIREDLRYVRRLLDEERNHEPSKP